MVEREHAAVAAQHGLLQRVAEQGETAPLKAAAQLEVGVSVRHAVEVRQVAGGGVQ